MNWWDDAVVYQVYPRSFRDSDGDGVGDLAGIESGLTHIAALGCAALWLSPIYPSPGADMGYDVSDYRGVDPLFGSLEDFDRLLARAHALGLKVVMDIVPCHTSIEHRWFTEKPGHYVWADGRDGGPPNNWLANFGGPAWRQVGDGRWYLHSFYEQQPDLDWRNPEVVADMQGVLRFWLDRGVDGFRLDAIDRLLKDPSLRDDPPATRPFPLPLEPEFDTLDHVHSLNAPDIGDAVAALREAAGHALLVGEVFQPRDRIDPYLEHLDAAFAFEFFFAPWEAPALAGAIAAWDRGGAAWVHSNHDFPRVPARVGRENVRAAAVLLLTLPGPVFIYQGEEIGQRDSPPTGDDNGRDRWRHPVQWGADPATAGFTTGTPWLAPVDAPVCNVADQTGDPRSVLELYRSLIALRPSLRGEVELLDSREDVLAFRRGDHVVAVNTGAAPRPAPAPGDAVLATHPSEDPGTLPGHAATVTLTPNTRLG